MPDPFFNQTTCDRCPNDLKIRTTSWFTEETICMECSAKEDDVKKILRDNGIDDAMEGCGFVPVPVICPQCGLPQALCGIDQEQCVQCDFYLVPTKKVSNKTK